MRPRQDARLRLPRNVVALGFVSLLTDVASEVTVRTTPLFLKNVLGLPSRYIGMIEGIAQSVAIFVRLASGVLSDRMGRRKPLTLAGYGLSNLVKPLLYLAASWPAILAIRFVDRVGKGIRTAPRDALIAESVPAEDRGRAFGLHRSMDTIGSVLGLLAVVAVAYSRLGANASIDEPTYRGLVLVACVPAVLSVLVLALFVKEADARPPRPTASPAASPPAAAASALTPSLRRYLVAVFFFNLSVTSDAFFVLRAQELGLALWMSMALVALMCLVQACVSLPAGILADRIGRRGLVAVGWVLGALQLFGFGFATSPLELAGLFVLVGLYLGLSEGNEKALLADLAPGALKGTAFGLYNLALGVALLVASWATGALWDLYGARAAFGAGAVSALLGACLLVFVPLPPRGPAPTA